MEKASGRTAAWADEAIQERSGELTGLASDLIRIPSENPPGDTREVCDFCEGWLRSFRLNGGSVTDQQE
ncbi:MAG: hypothetical protein ACE5IM_12245, partial [Nitrospinota bacterium]